MQAILGNPAMIDAYKAGIPGNGKPFPDGAKMAKIHWNPKKYETAPGQPLVPNTLHDIDFIRSRSTAHKVQVEVGFLAVFSLDPLLRIVIPI